MSQTEAVQHTDSISSQDPNNEETKKTKSRRPANTAFRQQRLKAWQPILTPKTVIPLFFAVGVVFAPIGGLLLYASSQVQEISIDYTNCVSNSPELDNFDPDNRTISYDKLEKIPSGDVSSYFKTVTNNPPTWGHANHNYSYFEKADPVPTDVCVIEFTTPNDIGPPVLFYYRLTNFYQNHRRYVKSMDTAQLQGDARTADQIKSGDCDPLTTDSETGKPYYPCGLIANSLFNDTFEKPVLLGSSDIYNMTDTNIAWSSDKDLYKKTKYKNDEAVPPPNWKKRFPNGYTDDTPIPNINEWEAFQVWMRTAGLPTFSKLALRNDNEPMTAGSRYRLVVWDNFPVTKFGGTKSILISTRTVMGGKNPFLGIAYVVVGGICILLGAVFTATHLIKPRKLGDHRYLTWNNDQPSTATATGRSVRPGE